jgi:putative membrane protein
MVSKMKSLARKFLTEEEQKKITETVQRMEKKTSGEIVPMVASCSHDYPVSKAIGACFLTVPLSLLFTSFTGSYLWLGPQNMWLFLIYASLCFFPTYKLIGSNPALKRLFLLAGQVEEEVGEAAVSAFFKEGLYKTRQENGILLFISVLEKKVWILGDRGINERIPQAEWQDIINELSEGIRDNQQCEAICKAITRVGNVLCQHFPIQEDDQDELHNIIIQ